MYENSAIFCMIFFSLTNGLHYSAAKRQYVTGDKGKKLKKTTTNNTSQHIFSIRRKSGKTQSARQKALSLVQPFSRLSRWNYLLDRTCRYNRDHIFDEKNNF